MRYKTGWDPKAPRKKFKSPMDRYMSKVVKLGGCLIWTGATCNGYGRFSFQGYDVDAGRWLWEQINGAIPKNLLLCHKCDRPKCVKLDHKFLGTHKDNMKDCIDKNRRKPRGKNKIKVKKYL